MMATKRSTPNAASKGLKQPRTKPSSTSDNKSPPRTPRNAKAVPSARKTSQKATDPTSRLSKLMGDVIKVANDVATRTVDTTTAKSASTLRRTLEVARKQYEIGLALAESMREKAQKMWRDPQTQEVIRQINEQLATTLEKGKEIGIEIVESDMGQAAIKGGLAGAAVAVPLPLIGPLAGLLLGAAGGMYLEGKFGKKIDPKDVPSLMKLLDELKDKGFLTEAEYTKRHKKLIKAL